MDLTIPFIILARFSIVHEIYAHTMHITNYSHDYPCDIKYIKQNVRKEVMQIVDVKIDRR